MITEVYRHKRTSGYETLALSREIYLTQLERCTRQKLQTNTLKQRAEMMSLPRSCHTLPSQNSPAD